MTGPISNNPINPDNPYLKKTQEQDAGSLAASVAARRGKKTSNPNDVDYVLADTFIQNPEIVEEKATPPKAAPQSGGTDRQRLFEELEAFEQGGLAGALGAVRTRGRSTEKKRLDPLEQTDEPTAETPTPTIEIVPKSSGKVNEVDPTRFEVAARYYAEKPDFPGLVGPNNIQHFEVWDPNAKKALHGTREPLHAPAEGILLGGIAGSVSQNAPPFIALLQEDGLAANEPQLYLAV